MRAAVLTFIIGVMFQASVWACSCGGNSSFCSSYNAFGQVALGRIDSIRSDSAGIYFTIFEPIKSTLQANVQVVLEEDTFGVEDMFTTCWSPMVGYMTAGDTVIMSFADTAGRFDTISQEWAYRLGTIACSSHYGFLKVNNGRVEDGGEDWGSWGFSNPYSYSIETTYVAYRDMLLEGGCAGFDTIVSVEDIAPIDQQQIIYSKGVFSVDDVSNKGTFNCYNLAGQRVLSSNGNTLDAAELRSGIYIVEYLNNGKVIREKFFIP